VAVAWSAVPGWVMISSSGIFSTGEKKCSPITCPGRDDASASRAMGMVEVLEPSTRSSEACSSISRITRCFSSTSSNTASTTSSAVWKPAYSVVGCTRSTSW
jgi:hypothetical protein